MDYRHQEFKSSTAAALAKRKRHLGIRAGALVVLALALAATSLLREGLGSIPGLAIAVATLVVAFSAFRQIKAISRELASRKR